MTGAAALVSGKGKAKIATSPVAGPKSDLSIPYDAAARLAYEELRNTRDFDEADFQAFKAKYEQLAVAEVTAKKLSAELWPEPTTVDLSIPYDAAARLAYDKWRAMYGKGDFDTAEYAVFKVKYEQLAVAEVISKKLEKEMAEL